jgi:hypothetical protein
MPKSILAATVALLTSLLGAVEHPSEFSGPAQAGQLAEPTNLETSGLAVSTRTPGLLWTHNDSGGEPVLFALALDGSLRGSVRLSGVVNRDWEDVTAFMLDGRSWLLAAETGDNYAKFTQCALHVVAEPAADELNPTKSLDQLPAYTIHFVYEDGPRDCEAVAVDVRERAVYLLTKRDYPNRLYRLPLAATLATQPAVAHRVGTAWAFPQPDALQRLSPQLAVAYGHWPTAMNFLPDGSGAFVLTYGALYFFPREAGESWTAALARAPTTLPPFSLPQAEALAVSPDGADVYVASERTPLFYRYTRRP